VSPGVPEPSQEQSLGRLPIVRTPVFIRELARGHAQAARQLVENGRLIEQVRQLQRQRARQERTQITPKST